MSSAVYYGVGIVILIVCAFLGFYNPYPTEIRVVPSKTGWVPQWRAKRWFRYVWISGHEAATYADARKVAESWIERELKR